MSLQKFKIGQVAELMGLSAETIRYYEKKGLIEPREIRNTYRYYDMNLMGKMGLIRNYIQYGFSVEEVRELVNSEDSRLIGEKIGDRMAQIENEVQEKLEIMRGLRKMQNGIYRAETQIERISIQTRPEYYSIETYEHSAIVETEEQYRLHRLLFKNPTYCDSYIRFTPEEIEEDVSHVTHCGMLIKCSDWHNLHQESTAGLRMWPACRAVHALMKVEPVNRPISQILAPMLQYIKENNLTICGDILAPTVRSSFLNGSIDYERDVYIPILEG